MHHTRINERLDKIERSLSSDDLSRLWLRRALSFERVADYVAWFNDQAKSARALRIFERQLRNAMRGSNSKSRLRESKFQLLHDTVLSLRLFVELNLDCAAGCDELTNKLRTLVKEAGKIFRGCAETRTARPSPRVGYR